jgi:hypothetical protein
VVNRAALAVSHYRNVPFANCTGGGGGACTLAKLFGCKIASSESKYLRRKMLHDACSSATCNAQARVLHPAHWALRDECCSACCAASANLSQGTLQCDRLFAAAFEEQMLQNRRQGIQVSAASTHFERK